MVHTQSPHIIQNDIIKDIGFEIGKDAIYEYIWRFYPEWKKYLTRQKKYKYKNRKSKKQMKIENKINISERCEKANQRQ